MLPIPPKALTRNHHLVVGGLQLQCSIVCGEAYTHLSINEKHTICSHHRCCVLCIVSWNLLQIISPSSCSVETRIYNVPNSAITTNLLNTTGEAASGAGVFCLLLHYSACTINVFPGQLISYDRCRRMPQELVFFHVLFCTPLPVQFGVQVFPV